MSAIINTLREDAPIDFDVWVGISKAPQPNPSLLEFFRQCPFRNNYTAGTNIEITPDNVINNKLTAGTGIEITPQGVINNTGGSGGSNIRFGQTVSDATGNFVNVQPVVLDAQGNATADGAVETLLWNWNAYVPIPTANLYLKLDGTDSPAVSATYVSDAKFGTVAQFQNSDVTLNGISTGRNINDAFSAYAISICGWYKSSSSIKPLIHIGESYGLAVQYGIISNAGSVGILYSAGQSTYLDSAFGGNLNEWNFFCLVFDNRAGETSKLYINNSVFWSGTLPAPNNFASLNTQLCIGGWNLNDEMAHVRVYENTILGEDAIQALYHEFD